MILEGRQPSTQALSCIRTPGLSGRYLQRRRIHANRASVPVVTAAATAPAVFDGYASGLRLRRCPQIFLHDVGREPDTFARSPRGSGDPASFAFITGKSNADLSLRSGVIGRASCRERGSQNVTISRGGVSLKNKTTTRLL